MKRKEKIRKAAKILLSLGEEVAAEVLKYLSEKEQEALIREILEIGKVSPEERIKLLKELKDALKEERRVLYGGKEEARKLLEKALGKEKAEEYLKKVEEGFSLSRFRELEEYSPQALSKLLEGENPQIIALILSQLSPVYSAKVLQNFPSKLSAEVARRIAFMERVNPEAAKITYQMIRKKLENIPREEAVESKGVEKLAKILTHLDPSLEEKLLSEIEKEKPSLAEELKEKLYLFEDLIALDMREIQRIFERIGDREIWAKALKGADEELKNHILSSISINRAEDIRQEMELLGKVPKREVEEARKAIMRMAEELEKEGKIIFHKDRETFIE